MLALDANGQLALAVTAAGTLVLPREVLRGPESYRDAAARCCGRLLGDPAPRWGKVTGHRWASGSPTDVRVEEHVLIAQPARKGGAFPAGTAVLWADRERLGELLRGADLGMARDLTSGYLDGWLPDGPITLD
ncbi:hypothetical protein CFP65_4563 [Kitasatospora sp. MMS16-BH015]|nr:hypothetical protein CFP65_4563 [Kitasatospora sp. MMS16-BH015]